MKTPLLNFLFILFVAILWFGYASRAKAHVSCTLTGTVKIEPMDQNFCSTTYFGCGGWKEVDLDNKRGANAVPVKYLRVDVRTDSDTWLGTTFTDTNGNWTKTVSVDASTCSGQILKVYYLLMRVHESDIGAGNPRYRFRIVDWDNPDYTWATYKRVTLTQNPTTVNMTIYTSTNPTTITRVFNIYYTANSAMTEIVTWSTNLSTTFASTYSELANIMRIKVGTGFPYGGGSTDIWEWSVDIAYDAYGFGTITRHEIGHLTMFAIHHKHQMLHSCLSRMFGGYFGLSRYGCEYGFNSTIEGLANFIAVRSLTTADTFVWDCKCFDPYLNQQKICSATAASLSKPDQQDGCNGGEFIAIGDHWANDTNDCALLIKAHGCYNCSEDVDAGTGTGYCVDSYRKQHGWRNTTQVTRFLWDMIDTNNEGGKDDTDLSMVQFVSAMENMPCTGSDYHVDGSCNEADREDAADCDPDPAHEGEVPSQFMYSRDSYNIWDIATRLSGDQYDERLLNCVQGAKD